jgi:glycosyltransferase involved in cell wall biosynthesis
VERSQDFPTNKPFVHRIDGVWSRADEIGWKNRNIIETYNTADAVIFQSIHGVRQVTSWFGWPQQAKLTTVVHNGAELGPTNEVHPLVQKLRSQVDTMFVCAATWHRQKRLRETIELFFHLRTTQFPSSCLVVLGGQVDHKVEDPGVAYLGDLDHDFCRQIYSVSDWMLHLCWGDNCPNVVVEALTQGCRVLCTDVGGTKELVGPYGYIYREPVTYDYSPNDYLNPPPLGSFSNVVLPAIQRACQSRLGIDTVAVQYQQVLQTVLDMSQTSNLSTQR